MIPATTPRKAGPVRHFLYVLDAPVRFFTTLFRASEIPPQTSRYGPNLSLFEFRRPITV